MNRYTIDWVYCEEDADGEYVRYEDVAEMEAENKRLQNEVISHQNEADRLREALNKAGKSLNDTYDSDLPAMDIICEALEQAQQGGGE